MTSELNIANFKNWRKLQEYDTDFSADSIEFCPIRENESFFLCGTYQLTKNESDESNQDNMSTSSKRKGTILLFELNIDTQSFHLLDTTLTHAILDIKWSHCKINDKIVFGIVNSIGELVIYEFINTAEITKPFIKKICHYQLELPENSTEILALSLDWSSRILSNSTHCINTDNIVVSNSKGGVSFFLFGQNGLELIQNWNCHDFECWISAFNYNQTSIVYSGGDDCKLKIYDTRQERVILTNSVHGAGVTSIQYNPFKENELATGSYDEYLYIWDCRNFKSYKNNYNLNGGIWRIKYQSEYKILTATMYNGFHYVNIEDTSNNILLYNEHDGNIAYGIDSYYKNKKYIVTCSFYNHLMNLSILE